MYRYKKKFDWDTAVIIVLAICSLVLYINNQQQNKEILEYREVNNQLYTTAQKAITDLADCNEHIRAYEIRISQLEEELAYYQ